MAGRSGVSDLDADSALTRLHADNYLSLVRTAVLLVRDQALAEDVVQDCFVELLRRWDRLNTAEFKPAAYLRTSVVNRSRSALRHRAVVARTLSELVTATNDEALVIQRRLAVLDALGALPARQREVLVLRHYLDLSERTTAEVLGISVGTVKSHASRGATALRAQLGLQEER